MQNCAASPTYFLQNTVFMLSEEHKKKPEVGITTLKHIWLRSVESHFCSCTFMFHMWIMEVFTFFSGFYKYFLIVYTLFVQIIYYVYNLE